MLSNFLIVYIDKIMEIKEMGARFVAGDIHKALKTLFFKGTTQKFYLHPRFFLCFRLNFFLGYLSLFSLWKDFAFKNDSDLPTDPENFRDISVKRCFVFNLFWPKQATPKTTLISCFKKTDRKHIWAGPWDNVS